MSEEEERYLMAKERTRLAMERNRLANLRTYLAWTRTGLATVGGGLAMVRFVTFHNVTHQMISQVIGFSLVVLGIVIFGLSFFDYRSCYKKMNLHNGYAGSISSIFLISFFLIAASVAVLWITVNKI